MYKLVVRSVLLLFAGLLILPGSPGIRSTQAQGIDDDDRDDGIPFSHNGKVWPSKKAFIDSGRFSAASFSFAANPQDTQSPKQDMKDAGHATKNAAKDTGHATKNTAKRTGHATKRTSKSAAHKTARKTRQGAEKVEDKTR